MKVISVRNVEEAIHKGLQLIYKEGIRETSRAGDVLVMPEPVVTVYEKPQERVLFSPERDANPFFHIFEALFMLAGRQDAKWLDQFIHDFSSRFAEPDGRIHDAYGFRWRKHFDMEGGGSPYLPDQLDTIVKLLRNNPQDRQAVLVMWDPVADLGVPGLKTRPCNTHCYLRVRSKVDVKVKPLTQAEKDARILKVDLNTGLVLDITVCCRSNDLWWGAYGANACQFSILQEYLAARIVVGIGTYTQISNNYHLYFDMDEKAKKVLTAPIDGSYAYNVETTELVTVPTEFDVDLERFMYRTASSITPYLDKYEYRNCFFHEVAEPLFWANRYWKQKERQKALAMLAQMPPRSDWRLAAYNWMQRRMGKE
jgi:thymidylate synthase